jgi:hypothetical protein
MMTKKTTPKPSREVATSTPLAPRRPPPNPHGPLPGSQPQQQPVSMTAAQIQQAATAGVALFGRESTLIPGNMRQQVAVLEVILQGIVAGRLMVVTPQQNAVESGPNAG